MCYNDSTHKHTIHFEDGAAMTKDIILFDTDGNLTESKQKFNSINLSSLLIGLNEHVNTVMPTDSNCDYLEERLSSLLNSSIRYCLHLLLFQQMGV
jgi:hypothetical protein